MDAARRPDPERPNPERLASITNAFSKRQITVVGDLVADQFIYGEIARVSREAPVFILRHEHTETSPGGAANCAANLASLGAQVRLVGFVGDDRPGRALLDRLCSANVDCRGVITLPSTGTTTKVRILAGQAHSTRQQVIRIDYEHELPSGDTRLHERLLDSLHRAVETCHALVISDYDYGVAGEEMIGALEEIARTRRFPVLVDSRFNLTKFKGFTSATPNEDEVEHALGRRLGERSHLEEAAKELRARLDCRALLMTRGPHGMLLQEKDARPLHIEAVGSREPVDVTGAGDTVMATYALALAAGASFVEAAHLANHAGGLVVMKRGTASVSREEILKAVSGER